jgi:hypothetical protein
MERCAAAPQRTGAPANASTALMPTVRSNVLLPDMFDPLTTSKLGPGPPDPRRERIHAL